jgi:hypothetical protein
VGRVLDRDLREDVGRPHAPTSAAACTRGSGAMPQMRSAPSPIMIVGALVVVAALEHGV